MLKLLHKTSNQEMKPLLSEPTKHSPGIKLDPDSGYIEFYGKSRPEDALLFYEPVHKWLKHYSANPQPKTNVVFKLEYFNSASAKHIKHILEFFPIIKQNGSAINIDWYYLEDDEDMRDLGEEYATLIEIPFNLIAY